MRPSVGVECPDHDAAAVPAATAEIGDRRGILLGETCTATR